jgi:hypothetical protein
VARFDGLDGLELWRVDVAEVRGFVVEVCPRLGRRAAQLTVVALRALLRILHLEGVLDRSLAGAVPSVAGWRLSGLPKRLELSPDADARRKRQRRWAATPRAPRKVAATSRVATSAPSG